MKTFKQFCEGKTQLYGLSIKELLDTVLNFNGKTLIYFDTETMGLTPKKDYLQLTEIAAVAYDGSTFKEYLKEVNSKYIVSKNPSDKKWYAMGHVGSNKWMPVSSGFKNKAQAQKWAKSQDKVDIAARGEISGA